MNTSSSSGTSSQDVDPEVVTPNGYSLQYCSDGALDLKIVDPVYGSVVAVEFIVPRMMAIGFSLWIDNLLPSIYLLLSQCQFAEFVRSGNPTMERTQARHLEWMVDGGW